MTAKRKRKESFLVNNIIIVIALGLLAFFYYREQTTGKANAAQRTPKDCLNAFGETYRKVFGQIVRADQVRPNVEPDTLADLNPTEGWKGLDSFFFPEDIKWLKSFTNYISIGVMTDQGRTVDEWKKKTIWERFVMARGAVLQGAPAGGINVTEDKVTDQREEKHEVKIDVGGGSMVVTMRYYKGAYRIVGFFGGRGRWEGRSADLYNLLPPDQRDMPQ